jgi:hypothetical protein
MIMHGPTLVPFLIRTSFMYWIFVCVSANVTVMLGNNQDNDLFFGRLVGFSLLPLAVQLLSKRK